MSNNMVGLPAVNITNSRKALIDYGGSDTDLATPLNYTSISAMRTRLAAISGSYYTSARLDAMTENDMIFALRNHDDATSIASFMSNTTP